MVNNDTTMVVKTLLA